jgi:DNA-binding MarR family transcriptional regulator
MTAVTSVMRTQQILLAELNQRLHKYGLTFPRYEALMVLLFSRTGSLPRGKLGQRLQVHRTSVTNIVDKLERDGFVRREAHATDRRATLATITDEGRALAATATEELNGLAFALEGLSPAQEEQLTDLLEVVRRTAGDFTG